MLLILVQMLKKMKTTITSLSFLLNVLSYMHGSKHLVAWKYRCQQYEKLIIQYCPPPKLYFVAESLYILIWNCNIWPFWPWKHMLRAKNNKNRTYRSEDVQFLILWRRMAAILNFRLWPSFPTFSWDAPLLILINTLKLTKINLQTLVREKWSRDT